MKRWPGAKIGVVVLTILTLIYVVAVFQLAWGLVASGEPIAIAMGVFLVIFPVIGVVFVIRDLLFALRGNELLARMAAAGELPEDDLPRRPSGRPVLEAADAEFRELKRDVETHPDDYRAWARLALGYKASGDAARARKAMRQAIALERAGSTGGPAEPEKSDRVAE